VFLCELVLEADWSLEQTKDAIWRATPAEFRALLQGPQHFRVREKIAAKLTRVLRADVPTLRANVSAGTLKDYKQLAVQRVSEGDPVSVLSSELLLSVARWHPRLKRLDAAEEIVLQADARFQELQERLSGKAAKEDGLSAEDIERQKQQTNNPHSAAAAASTEDNAATAAVGASSSSSSSSASDSSAAVYIPSECVGFEKPLPYQLLDPSAHLSSLKFNVDWVSSSSTLSSSVDVIRVRDGDVLVWTDVRAQGVALYNEYREQDDIVHNTARGEREKQHALKIYSPQEQAEMEHAIRLVEEMEKKAAATTAAAGEQAPATGHPVA